MSTLRSLTLAIGLLALLRSGVAGQEAEIERPGAPAREDFEVDANRDGLPDGWYNVREAGLEAKGGVVGPGCLRFRSDRPGRSSRASRAFGVDGREVEAIIIGLWVRVADVRTGERMGEDPSLIIDFLGDGLRAVGRGTIGPWKESMGTGWVRVARRIAVPPDAREALMTVGLLGATGTLEIDAMTFDLIPAGGEPTANLVLNGGFELGTPEPFGWLVEQGARRASPGFRSDSALELTKAGSRAARGLSMPVGPYSGLDLTVAVRARGLRGSGGAAAHLIYFDEGGRTMAGPGTVTPVFRWSGTFDWRADRARVSIPRGAVRAVFQVEKPDANGSIRLDELKVTAAPEPEAGLWTPYHVEDDKTGWLPVLPSPTIVAGSALDASSLLEAPAGGRGFVTVRDGRLGWTKGGRAQFFGVSLLPPTAFQDRERADALADRLARSGINLVRLGDLDVPLGPDRSLFDDSRDDTKAFDPLALAKLDHLIAALKARGVYVALEIQGARQFRAEDGVADPGRLPPGGGPSATFDPAIVGLAREAARALLAHVNPETGLALRDDPVLAWVTLAGEVSLFDLIDDLHSPSPEDAAALKTRAQASPHGSGRRFWQAIESAHWKELADALRGDGLRVPVAGASHWRREPEFAAAQAAPGLDLIDDRLYWNAPPWMPPERRSILWSPDGGLAAGASRKRKADRPYAVGQWCHQTLGAWAYPHEGADVLLAAQTAASQDWDALVRRGVFLHPQAWGASAVGTGGVEDIFQLPEVVNGIPQVFALLPHAASLTLQAREDQPGNASRTGPSPARRMAVAGWEPTRGRLVIDTPHTQGLAGWPGGDPADLDDLTVTTEDPFAVVVATSVGPAPIATSKRLLVTALARVEPSGFRWADSWKREVAHPGAPPLLQEPVRATVRWKHKGPVKAYSLDNTGARLHEVALKTAADGVVLVIDGRGPGLHWELVAE